MEAQGVLADATPTPTSYKVGKCLWLPPNDTLETFVRKIKKHVAGSCVVQHVVTTITPRISKGFHRSQLTALHARLTTQTHEVPDIAAPGRLKTPDSTVPGGGGLPVPRAHAVRHFAPMDRDTANEALIGCVVLVLHLWDTENTPAFVDVKTTRPRVLADEPVVRQPATPKNNTPPDTRGKEAPWCVELSVTGPGGDPLSHPHVPDNNHRNLEHEIADVHRFARHHRLLKNRPVTRGLKNKNTSLFPAPARAG